MTPRLLRSSRRSRQRARGLRCSGSTVPASARPTTAARCTTSELEVRRHEILGIAGVAGNGQRELAQLCGAPRQSRHVGRSQVPSVAGYVGRGSRARQPGARSFSDDNAIVHAHRRGPDRRARAASAAARSAAFTPRLLARFAVDPTVVDRAGSARQLSGGNQQRLVLGRELDESSGLLVLHNPARGLDIAATSELFRQLDAFCQAQGGAAADLARPAGVARLGRRDPGARRRQALASASRRTATGARGAAIAHGGRRVSAAAVAVGRGGLRSTSGSSCRDARGAPRSAAS